MPGSHGGAVPPGLGAPPPDRTVADLQDRAEHGDPTSGARHGPLEDPRRAMQLHAQSLAQNGPLRLGRVVHAVPHRNWYRVQPRGGGPVTRACALAETGLGPSGPRPVGVIPPDSEVLYYQPPGLPFGLILGAVPEPAVDGGDPASGPLSGWLAQSGASGRLREPFERAVAGTAGGGGVLDFSCGSPLDATPFDWGRVTETGLALLLSPFQLQLSVNEACGLFASLFDAHLRLAGRNLLVESLAHQEEFLDDEGEPSVYRGEALYKREALGSYGPGGPGFDRASDAAAQRELRRGKVDLPDGAQAQRPFHRYREYGGYLGQGRQRFVAAPPEGATGPRLAGAGGPPDAGLLHEFLGVDGTYALRSAKAVYIGKAPQVIAPRRAREAADLAEGSDDAARGGYRAAGEFGDGPPHLVGDVRVAGDARSLRRAAGVLDLAAHAHGWKALHPFHYHAGDFETPQPSAAGPGYERLDFGALASADRMPDPEPRGVRVDGRYGEVSVYLRGSRVTLHEDGSVAVEAGCGERLLMADGNVTVDCPGDFRVAAGKRFVVLAAEAVVRAKGDLDLSAGTGAVRVKADREMQLLAGNSGTGAVLVESRAESPSHGYEGRFGTDVVSSGVVLRAPRSEVVALGGDVYLRTGGGGANPGTITLDAAKGASPVAVHASGLDVFGPGGLSVFVTPGGDATAASAAHHLGPAGAVIGTPAAVAGPLAVSGDVACAGSVLAAGSLACSGGLASGSGGPAGAVDAAFAGDVRRQVGADAGQAASLASSGSDRAKALLADRFYAPDGAAGSDRVLASIGFSFRDPPGEPVQYRTQSLVVPEPLWCQMARLGAATGGVPWEEPAVVCQGVETYPWPGRKKWAEDPSLLRLSANTLHDPAAGRDRDRPGPYEDASLAPWDPVTMRDGLKTVI